MSLKRYNTRSFTTLRMHGRMHGRIHARMYRRMHDVGAPTGQTLIETLLAAAVIVIGAVSLISLLVNVRSTSEASAENVSAIHLAAEAIESVRYIRDSNWLKMENGEPIEFTDTLFEVGIAPNYPDYSGIVVWDPAQSNPDLAIQMNFTGDDINHANAIVYQDASGYFRQTATAPVPGTWTATKFRRWLTVYPICFNPTLPAPPETEVLVTSNGQSCADLNSTYYQIGVQVQSQVQWTGRGGTVHTRTVEERMYNWKYPNPDFANVVF